LYNDYKGNELMKASQMIAISATAALGIPVAVIGHSSAPIMIVGVVFFTFVVMMMVMIPLLFVQLIKEINYGNGC